MNRVFKTAITTISIIIFANFLLIGALGIYRSIHAYIILYKEGMAGKPGLEIVESLDLFLIALVFLILSLSFMKLFRPDLKWFNIPLPWLRVDDFFQLKHLTWSALLLTLLITFGVQVLRASGTLEWSMLIIPVSVLLFSASAYLLKR